MKTHPAVLSSLIGLFLLSFTISKSQPVEKFCGYEMTINEINAITIWSEKNPNVYDVKNGSEIYSEINDSIRNRMPDTVEFEIFLSKLTKTEVCIDVFLPANEKFFETTACTMMNASFSKIVPAQKRIRIFSYTNPDGSGESRFETAIKSTK
jgi:hypothetical protein